jgi:hypothetical protein
MSDAEDKWMVYSWVAEAGHTVVGRCTKEMWDNAWRDNDRRVGLELNKCKMLVRGLTQEEAERFVALTKEEQ